MQLHHVFSLKFYFAGYHFTATVNGIPETENAQCGKLEELPSNRTEGVHSSGLTLDFRSNRLNTKGNVFVVLTCVKHPTKSTHQKRASLIADQDTECTPSMDLDGTILRYLDSNASDAR